VWVKGRLSWHFLTRNTINSSYSLNDLFIETVGISVLYGSRISITPVHYPLSPSLLLLYSSTSHDPCLHWLSRWITDRYTEWFTGEDRVTSKQTKWTVPPPPPPPPPVERGDYRRVCFLVTSSEWRTSDSDSFLLVLTSPGRHVTRVPWTSMYTLDTVWIQPDLNLLMY
jgi:hypothetical protein